MLNRNQRVAIFMFLVAEAIAAAGFPAPTHFLVILLLAAAAIVWALGGLS